MEVAIPSPELSVSILINNYNYEQFLSEAIESALAQTYTRIEIIVVDDGSTDNSRQILEHYRDRVTLVYKENGGQASAFNAGFTASTGDIICFLDSDDTFEPHKVAEIARVFEADEDVGWCFHPLKFVKTDESEPMSIYPPPLQEEVVKSTFAMRLI